MPDRRVFLAALAGGVAGHRFAWAQPAAQVRRICWLSSQATRAESYNVAMVEAPSLIHRTTLPSTTGRPSFCSRPATPE